LSEERNNVVIVACDSRYDLSVYWHRKAVMADNSMNAFIFRDQIIQSYERFSRSFVRISATDISKVVNAEYDEGRYWPEPLIQINPNYRPANTVQELVAIRKEHIEPLSPSSNSIDFQHEIPYRIPCKSPLRSPQHNSYDFRDPD